MTIVIAVDKFKGSLTAFEVCHAIAKGLQKAEASFQVVPLPLSDGGDGLADVVAHYTGAKKIFVPVSDPLFRPVQAFFLLSADGQTAFIEMAQASGLQRLQPHEYNPLQTSSFGTGELIKHALLYGVSKIVLGLGGSATNDGGMGMAAALGYRFLDDAGNKLKPVGENLHRIATIDAAEKMAMEGITVEVASDVANKLTGAEGAAKMYAAQKGATPQMIELLESGMLHFSSIVQRDFGLDLNAINGGGAAGGVGAGALFFLGAKLRSGINLLLQYSDAERHIAQADVVLTGEGRLDVQSLQGKVVQGVAALGKKYNKPVLALCGSLDVDAVLLQEAGITAAFSILTKPMSLQEAMAQAAVLLENAACNLGNFFKCPYK